MNEDFELSVTFNNSTTDYKGRLLNYGYSFKIEMDIQDIKVLFERDEERNWRALIPYEDVAANKRLNPELMKAIALAIEKATE